MIFDADLQTHYKPAKIVFDVYMQYKYIACAPVFISTEATRKDAENKIASLIGKKTRVKYHIQERETEM